MISPIIINKSVIPLGLPQKFDLVKNLMSMDSIVGKTTI